MNSVNNRRRYDGLSIEAKVDVALAMLEDLNNAFPDGPAKHREAHESWIAAKNAEAKFWQELKLDVAKKGAFGLLVTIMGLVLVGISVKSGVWFR